MQKWITQTGDLSSSQAQKCRVLDAASWNNFPVIIKEVAELKNAEICSFVSKKLSTDNAELTRALLRL